METWIVPDERSLIICVGALVHFVSAVCALAHMHYIAEYLDTMDSFRKSFFLMALFSFVGGPLSLLGWLALSKSKNLPLGFRFRSSQ